MAQKIIFTEEQILDIVNLYISGSKQKDIAKQYGTSRTTIERLLQRNNVISRHPLLDENRINYAIQLYDKYHNLSAVGNELHMSPSTVKEILKKNGIIYTHSDVNRKYHLNESYFDNIDSHEKAYFLGLLYADGNITKHGNYIRIQLQERDKHILYEFNKELESDYKLILCPYHERNPNWQDQYLLCIASKHMKETLISYGLTPNKSLTITFPDYLNEEYYPSFILGYWDGDGTILKNEKRCSVVGTEMFCKTLASIIKEKLDVNAGIYLCHGNDSVSTRCLRISGGKQVKRFLDWLYSSSQIYLKRKHDIYMNLYCA